MGRTKGPEKVMLRKRVEASKLAGAMECLEAYLKGSPLPVPANPSPSDGLPRSWSEPEETGLVKAEETPDPSIAALLDDIQGLTDEVEELRVALEEAWAADLDERGDYWRVKYLALEAKIRASQGEFSQ